MARLRLRRMSHEKVRKGESEREKDRERERGKNEETIFRPKGVNKEWERIKLVERKR